DLLDDASRRSYAASPEMDALTEPGALQEAQLIAARLDAVRSQAWLLIDCRGALQIRMGNTAIIIAKAVRRFAWQAKPAGAPHCLDHRRVRALGKGGRLVAVPDFRPRGETGARGRICGVLRG